MLTERNMMWNPGQTETKEGKKKKYVCVSKKEGKFSLDLGTFASISLDCVSLSVILHQIQYGVDGHSASA